jgi:two-component system chemotaxis response regulator CheY
LTAKESSVLIAEDTQTMRYILRGMIREYGFEEITDVIDGQQAIKQIEQNHFDLILCDWEMPNADGDEVLTFTKQSKYNNDSIFIMCTGNAKPEYVKKAISNGVSGFLAKPINQANLIKTLNQYFSTGD